MNFWNNDKIPKDLEAQTAYDENEWHFDFIWIPVSRIVCTEISRLAPLLRFEILPPKGSFVLIEVRKVWNPGNAWKINSIF